MFESLLQSIHSQNMLRWIVPIILILVGVLAGFIFDRFIYRRLKRIALRKSIPGSPVLFRSLQGIPKFWFIFAGLYAAFLSLQANQLISASFAEVIFRGITGAFLYSLVIICARVAADFVQLLSSRAQGVSASLLSNLARIVVFCFGILIVLQNIGISITPILATLGIGGLAIALAFQDTLSNLFSGLYLIISQQVRPGDYVKLEGGQEGYVSDITWRNTVIRELPNNVIVVPNSKLASAIFTNYHLPAKEINVPIQLGVSYESDLERVEKVTLEVAREVMQEFFPDSTDFQPFLVYQKFGEFSIDFTVFLRVNEFLDQRLAKHLFIKKLHRRYQQEEIRIPFPIRTIYMQENSSSL